MVSGCLLRASWATKSPFWASPRAHPYPPTHTHTCPMAITTHLITSPTFMQNAVYLLVLLIFMMTQ